MRVMKFGGGCLKNSNDFKQVAQIIKNKKDNLVVVVSAVYGVTNLLYQAMKKAFVSEIEIDKTIEKIRQIHLTIADEILNDELKDWVKAEIDLRIEKLRKNLYGICWTSEVTDSLRAMILSYGERFSTYLLAAVLKNEGIDSQPLESDKIGIITDESYDNASPDLLTIEKNLKSVILPLFNEKVVPVISGFFGITPDGKVSLFGRNGSDYSASIIAYALDDATLEIYKDVDGFLSADPKIVKEAKQLEKLSYDEAAELSYFGAKILHPRTVEPVSMKKIPIIIKNMNEPSKSGTIISSKKEITEKIIKSVTYNRNISVIRVHGAGVGYKPGVLSEIGKKFMEKNINIYSIITSQTSINLIIDREDSDTGLKVLKFLEKGIAEKVYKMEDMSLVAVVGEGIIKKEGIAASVFSAVANAGINIEMMSGGASDVAYYFIVEEKQVEKVINLVHSKFF